MKGINLGRYGTRIVLMGLFVLIINSVWLIPLDTIFGEGTVDRKFVILTFDDGLKSQYSNAKPILDKYGFKATFYVVCNYIEKGKNHMTWDQIKSLHEDGQDIGSHSMNHDDLSEMSKKEIEFEVGVSKECLLDHGINPLSFAYPFNSGNEDENVVDIVARYYEYARAGNDPLMFLHCNGVKNNQVSPKQIDCNTFSDDGTLNPVNRYSIIGWNHDSEKEEHSYNDSQMLDRFIEVVESQTRYREKEGTLNAIPIIAWHKIEDGNDHATSPDLFNAEMKYLYDNGFTVLSMADLDYNEKTNHLEIKTASHEPPGLDD
jgi:peptidoglycan/xylan/chitin deacetylase (PgdA/CDA1 family)